MSEPAAAIHRVRLRFAKRGPVRLVSHHDLLRCLERGLRRAGLPVARTQGFNPRFRIVFPLALGLGIEGHREVVDLELTEPLDPSEVQARLAAVSPEGLEFLEAESVPPHRAPRVVAADYRLELPEGPARDGVAAPAVAALLACTSRPFVRRRPDRTVEIDLRPFVLDAAFDAASGVLCFRLKVTPEGSARPEEIVETLGLRDVLDRGGILARTGVELAPNNPSPEARSPRPPAPPADTPG
jgi:radical SAM-linked protein